MLIVSFNQLIEKVIEKHKKIRPSGTSESLTFTNKAANGNRTRDLHLTKVTLYRLSHGSNCSHGNASERYITIERNILQVQNEEIYFINPFSILNFFQDLIQLFSDSLQRIIYRFGLFIKYFGNLTVIIILHVKI